MSPWKQGTGHVCEGLSRFGEAGRPTLNVVALSGRPSSLLPDCGHHVINPLLLPFPAAALFSLMDHVPWNCELSKPSLL